MSELKVGLGIPIEVGHLKSHSEGFINGDFLRAIGRNKTLRKKMFNIKIS